ncbi:hypothetical protein [Absidia glauca]|uniref:HTH myb-type domain-containing protein n=1 Tax=Absidia glauca TaxID=4829 RepID=A0A168QAP1_ABSGL|nr:hypothetical protein [Absidia glauca]
MGKSDKKEKHTHKKSTSREVKKDKKSKSGEVKKHKKSKKHSHRDKSPSKDTHTTTSDLLDQQQQPASATVTPSKRSIDVPTDPASPKRAKLSTSAGSNVVLPGKQYSSDSDSDSSGDDIKRPVINKVAPPPSAAVPTKQSARSKKYISDSDSDDTDNDSSRSKPLIKPSPAVMKATPKNKSTPAKQYSSNSDSDDTDNESRRPKTLTKPTPEATKATAKNKSTSAVKSAPAKQYSSDSDSDDTDNESRRPKTLTKPTPAATKATPKNKSTPAKQYSSDSDSDDSDSDTAENEHHQRSNPENVALSLVNGGTMTTNAPIIREPTALERRLIRRKSDTALGEYSSNRLQRNRMYRNKERDSKEEYARRFVDDADKYNVQHDFFISDSESESDSGDDYSGEPLPWHANAYNTEALRKKVEEEGWKLRGGRITRQEDIRLEKRIKKICRRENKTLEDFREMLDEEFSVNKSFWLKIAKVIPDRSMPIILRACRRRYNEHAYSKTPWTSEMDRQLLEYLKIDGKDFKLIEEKMQRSRVEIRSHAAELLHPEKTRVYKITTFSDEEFQDLTEKVSVYKGKVPWPKVTAAYNSAHPGNTRTLYQCQHAWRTRNRNKEFTVTDKLAFVRRMRQYGWKKETEMVMATLSDDFGYDMAVLKNFYLKSRTTIPDFEKKNVPGKISWSRKL